MGKLNDKFKPCPFCGGKATVIQSPNRSRYGEGSFYTIQCLICRCSTHPVFSPTEMEDDIDYEAVDELITIWNTRSLENGGLQTSTDDVLD